MVDRIKFHLAPRYYKACHSTPNGMERIKCMQVLQRAFGLTHKRSADLMDHNGSYGFGITCRPEQFARFIVVLHEIGNCINGIRDLEPRYVPQCEQHDIYSHIADILCISRYNVERVALALGHATPPALRDHVDISDND